MFKEIADIQTADMLNLPVPQAEFHTVAVQPTEIQKEMVASLAERAEEVAAAALIPRLTTCSRSCAVKRKNVSPHRGIYLKKYKWNNQLTWRGNTKRTIAYWESG